MSKLNATQKVKQIHDFQIGTNLIFYIFYKNIILRDLYKMTLVACLNIPQRAARQQVVSRSKDPLSSDFEKIALTNAFKKFVK